MPPDLRLPIVGMLRQMPQRCISHSVGIEHNACIGYSGSIGKDGGIGHSSGVAHSNCSDICRSGGSVFKSWLVLWSNRSNTRSLLLP